MACASHPGVATGLSAPRIGEGLSPRGPRAGGLPESSPRPHYGENRGSHGRPRTAPVGVSATAHTLSKHSGDTSTQPHNHHVLRLFYCGTPRTVPSTGFVPFTPGFGAQGTHPRPAAPPWLQCPRAPCPPPCGALTALARRAAPHCFCRQSSRSQSGPVLHTSTRTSPSLEPERRRTLAAGRASQA